MTTTPPHPQEGAQSLLDSSQARMVGALSAPIAQCVARGPEAVDAVAEVKRCARQARRDGVKPEQVVVAIRTAWWKAAKPAQVRAADLQRMWLTRLADVALDAYFDDADR